ncbi:MAG: aminoglycoside phosphotransferase (APT) family kinase protein [Gammaproteobacteria bacterium]|jgi:aminoglycoside phosphotransferase (APT) family kinase protein
MSGLAVAPISPDEIRDYLATQLPDATDLVLHDVAQIAVGWSHETWLFDLHYRQGGENQVLGLCLRRDPGNALLRHLSDLGEQFRVLKCLERTTLPTPKAYWYESDPSILGAPFLVMEKVAGSCPSPWGREGRAFYKGAAERGVLAREFTEALATLHTIDWQAAELDFLGIPTPGRGFAEREIVKWRELIATTEHPPEPILTDLIGWLETNIPPTDRVTLVHGAYRTGNLLIDNDRVSAVLDWELQVLGDPMYDVAYVLSDLNREGTHLLSNLVERDAFIRDYEAATGFTVDEDACRYYNALYAMRSVAFWMSASDLYATGRSNDIRLARTAWSVPVVLDRAARDLGY